MQQNQAKPAPMTTPVAHFAVKKSEQSTLTVEQQKPGISLFNTALKANTPVLFFPSTKKKGKEKENSHLPRSNDGHTTAAVKSPVPVQTIAKSTSSKGLHGTSNDAFFAAQVMTESGAIHLQEVVDIRTYHNKGDNLEDKRSLQTVDEASLRSTHNNMPQSLARAADSDNTSAPAELKKIATIMESSSMKEGVPADQEHAIINHHVRLLLLLSKSKVDLKNSPKNSNEKAAPSHQHQQTESAVTKTSEEKSSVLKVWKKENKDNADFSCFLAERRLNSSHHEPNDNKETASVSDQTTINRSSVGSSVRSRSRSNGDAPTNGDSDSLLSLQDNLEDNGKRSNGNSELKIVSETSGKKVALASPQPVNIINRDPHGFDGDIIIKNGPATSSSESEVQANNVISNDGVSDEQQESAVLYLMKLLRVNHDNVNHDLQRKGKKTFERMDQKSDALIFSL